MKWLLLEIMMKILRFAKVPYMRIEENATLESGEVYYLGLGLGVKMVIDMDWVWWQELVNGQFGMYAKWNGVTQQLCVEHEVGLWKLHTSLVDWNISIKEGYKRSWFFARDNGTRVFDAWEWFNLISIFTL